MGTDGRMAPTFPDDSYEIPLANANGKGAVVEDEIAPMKLIAGEG
ncbi:hypothetical protein AB3479_11415 [Rhizobium mongolense]